MWRTPESESVNSAENRPNCCGKAGHEGVESSVKREENGEGQSVEGVRNGKDARGSEKHAPNNANDVRY